MVSNSENAISFDPSVGRPLNSAPNMVNPASRRESGSRMKLNPPNFTKRAQR